jgi:hypothetical protein
MMNARWMDAVKAGAVLVPAALVVGLVLGGYAPRRDLQLVRAELEWLQSQSGRRGGRLESLTQMVQIPAETPRPRRVEPEPRDPASGDEPLAEPTAQEVAAPVQEETVTLAERLDTARELWALRSEMARNTFVSRAVLNPEEAARFDVLMDAMNIRIRDGFQNAVVAIESEGELTPERITRLLHEVTGALALTYDEMDRTLPAHWRQAAGRDLELFDFIDPSVAEPLLEVEGLLEESPRYDRRRRSGR